MGEGFFLSVIQKKDSTGSGSALVEQGRAKNKKRKQTMIAKSIERQLGNWMKEGTLNYVQIGDAVHAMPPDMIYDFEMLKNCLYLKKAGIRIGKAGENDWIPDHELALADILRNDIPCMELSLPDALRFLSGESLDDLTSEKGWNLVSYMGHPMGWVKWLDRRMNNYYPKSWRIRR
jgi:NOL1/NOP2/fmu family ribosome biogenesis protein